MKLKKSQGLSATGTLLFHLLIYIVFIAYTIYLIINATTIAMRITYIIILIVMVSVAFFYELLQFKYAKAIKTLNYDCDPELARSLFDELEKLDFAHAYRNQRTIFNVLYNLAIYNPNEVINIVNDNDKIFRANIDQLLIRNASLFLANVEANNKTAAKKAYPDIIKLKGAKVKGKKLDNLYNWDELEALNYFISNDYKKAINTYKNVNETYMNNREKTQLYYYYGLALKYNGQEDFAKQQANKIITIGNKLEVVSLAKEL